MNFEKFCVPYKLSENMKNLSIGYVTNSGNILIFVSALTILLNLLSIISYLIKKCKNKNKQ